MSVLSATILPLIGEAMLAVALSAAAVGLLLCLARPRSPAIHRFAWTLVLAQGVVPWRAPLDLPVLPRANQPTGESNVASAIEQRWGDSAALFSESQASVESIDLADARHMPQWCSILLAAWLCGPVITITYYGWAYVAFCRALPAALPVEEEWAEEFDQLCHSLSLGGRVRLHVTEHLGPALCLSPAGYRLLVPDSVWRTLAPAQRQAIVRHELEHYRRGDLWKSLLARMAALPQWFNPLAWYAVRRFEEAAEWACDDAVQASVSEHTFEYLRALVLLGGSGDTGPSLQAAIGGGSLPFRVRRLLSPPGKDSTMKRVLIVVATLTVAAAGMARLRLASAVADEPRAATVEGLASAAQSPAEAQADVPADRTRKATPAFADREAVIDLNRVFKESRAFRDRKEALRGKISRWDMELRQKRARLATRQQKLRMVTDPELQRSMQEELEADKADLQRRAGLFQKEAMDEEAAAYHDVYEAILKAVAEHAKQNGIRQVRRSQTVAAAAAEDRFDSKDRSAILARLNRDILYTDPQQVDITDAIVERLNASQDEP